MFCSAFGGEGPSRWFDRPRWPLPAEGGTGNGVWGLRPSREGARRTRRSPALLRQPASAADSISGRMTQVPGWAPTMPAAALASRAAVGSRGGRSWGRGWGSSNRLEHYVEYSGSNSSDSQLLVSRPLRLQLFCGGEGDASGGFDSRLPVAASSFRDFCRQAPLPAALLCGRKNSQRWLPSEFYLLCGCLNAPCLML